MPRVAGYILWFAIVFGITAGLHYYFWARLVRDAALPPLVRTALGGLIVALGVSLPAAFLVGRSFAAAWRDLFVKVAFVWMGVMFFLFLLLVVGDLGRWLVGAARRLGETSSDVTDPLRRLFVSRVLAGGAALGAFGLGGVALAGAAKPPPLKRVPVRLARFPRALDGFKIVQISDLHIGQPIHRAYVSDVVRRTNALDPDLVVITGDLVDGGTTLLRDDVAPIADLRAKHGVFFVTGNHEYYAGVGPWIGELTRLGVRVLRNEHVLIGHGDAAFVLAGVDDHSAKRMEPGHGEDVAKAVSGVDARFEIILLAHQPAAIHEAVKHGVGLQLSGHTHGGQLWPFTLLVGLTQPHVAGLAWHGATQIYVSRGTGHWGPPMRLGAPSELTVLELSHGAPPPTA
jgi:hypothetical protein